MTQNIAHNNPPKGILITQDNLTRFNKRLHKAMQEDGLDISYSKAANIFAKACGKKNLHEITELLKELSVAKEDMSVSVTLNKRNKSFTSIKENQGMLMDLKPHHPMPHVYEETLLSDSKGELIEMKTLPDLNLGDVAALKDLKWAFESVLSSYIKNSKVVFQFTPDAPDGSFSFVVLRIINGNLKQDVIRYENFVQVNEKLDNIFAPIVDFLNYVFEIRGKDKRINFLNNWKKLWKLEPGFNFEILTSDVFSNIKPVFMAGFYKQGFALVSQADFFNIKENVLSEFSYKTKNGVEKSKIVNTVNVKAFAPYIKGTAPDLKAAIKLLEGFDDEAFLFEVLEPLNPTDDKTLSRFFVSKTLKPFGFNQQSKFMITLANYGNASSLYELNNLSDLSFFEGVLEKDFPLPRTPVNAPNFNKVYDGFKS